MAVNRVQRTYGDRKVNIAIDDEPNLGLLPDLWPSMGEYPVYDPFIYYLMTNDHLRNEEFRRVLRRFAPGNVVVDIGTGQDMNWAMEAARAGASRVIAAEVMDASYVAAIRRLQTAPEAGLIELVHTSSFSLQLPQRAKVCVAEVIGSIASAEGILAVIADASKRLLNEGAVVIPKACSTIVGAISLRSLFPKGIAFSCDSLPYLHEVFLQYGRAFDIRLAVANLDPECVISTTVPVEALRFDGEEPLDDCITTQLEMVRSGEIDGLLCWIRLEAGSGARIIDSLIDKTSWIPAYLPLFDTPVSVAQGDRMTVEFHRRTSDDGIHPDYEIQAVLSVNGLSVSGSHISAHHGTTLGSSAVHRDLIDQLDSGC
jgi:type I protein arginine methyltransferase